MLVIVIDAVCQQIHGEKEVTFFLSQKVQLALMSPVQSMIAWGVFKDLFWK